MRHMGLRLQQDYLLLPAIEGRMSAEEMVGSFWRSIIHQPASVSEMFNRKLPYETQGSRSSNVGLRS